MDAMGAGAADVLAIEARTTELGVEARRAEKAFRVGRHRPAAAIGTEPLGGAGSISLATVIGIVALAARIAVAKPLGLGRSGAAPLITALAVAIALPPAVVIRHCASPCRTGRGAAKGRRLSRKNEAGGKGVPAWSRQGRRKAYSRRFFGAAR